MKHLWLAILLLVACGSDDKSSGSVQYEDCGTITATMGTIQAVVDGTVVSSILRSPNICNAYDISQGTYFKVWGSTLCVGVGINYNGPGTYEGVFAVSDPWVVAWYIVNNNVFASIRGATCNVCVNSGERSGTFSCTALYRFDSDDETSMSLTNGSFLCPDTENRAAVANAGPDQLPTNL